MKKNIAFISLKSQFCKDVCKSFCDDFEMIYADFNDILQFNLVNQNMLSVAGKEYFDAEEQKVLKSIVSCENIVLNIDFVVLNKGENLKLVKETCLIIYLKFTKKLLEQQNKKTDEQQKKLLVAYDAENKICSGFADLIVEIGGNVQKDCKKITENIKKFYNI